MTASENKYSMLKDLEREQIRIANGGIDPVPKAWVPVQRVSMSDAEVDALIAGADEEITKTLTDDATAVTSSIGATVIVQAKKPTKKVVKKAVVKKEVVKKAVAKKVVKKIDIAREIFKTNKKAERKDVLKLFIKKMKMSPQAASTYYQLCKKG